MRSALTTVGLFALFAIAAAINPDMSKPNTRPDPPKKKPDTFDAITNICEGHNCRESEENSKTCYEKKVSECLKFEPTSGVVNYCWVAQIPKTL